MRKYKENVASSWIVRKSTYSKSSHAFFYSFINNRRHAFCVCACINVMRISYIYYPYICNRYTDKKRERKKKENLYKRSEGSHAPYICLAFWVSSFSLVLSLLLFSIGRGRIKRNRKKFEAEKGSRKCGWWIQWWK